MIVIEEALERLCETREEFDGVITDLNHEMVSLRARIIAFDRKLTHIGQGLAQLGKSARALSSEMDRYTHADSEVEFAPMPQRRHYRSSVIGVSASENFGRSSSIS